MVVFGSIEAKLLLHGKCMEVAIIAVLANRVHT